MLLEHHCVFLVLIVTFQWT